MEFKIDDTRPIISANYRVVGAALKILVAGGAALDDESRARASGMTAWVWERQNDSIMRLVERLELEAA